MFVPTQRESGTQHSFRVVSTAGSRLLPAFTSVDALARSHPAGQEYGALDATGISDLVQASGAEGLLVDGGTSMEITIPLDAIAEYMSLPAARAVGEVLLPAGSKLEIRPAPPVEPVLASDIRKIANASRGIVAVFVLRMAASGAPTILTIGAEFDQNVDEASRRAFLMQLGELSQPFLNDFQVQELSPDFSASLSRTVSPLWKRSDSS